MAKIIIKSECGLYDGMPVTFKAPCACNAVDGLKVQYGDEAAVFKFKDAHGNDLTGLGNLFDKGAIVKAVLDTKSGGAFVQNADTNAYIEGRFAEMVQSVNGQRGDVILTPDRIGAASSSVADITVTATSKTSSNLDENRVSTLTGKLYTAGHLFVLDIPEYLAGNNTSSSYADTIDCSALPDGYRILDVLLEHEKLTLSSVPYVSGKDTETQTITIKGFPTTMPLALRVYGVVEGDAASGSGGTEPDWVQAVINAAQTAVSIAEEAKEGTETFAATLDALDTGLSDAKEDINALEQAQQGMSDEIDVAKNDIANIKWDIAELKENGGGGTAAADLSKLEAVQGIEKATEGDTVYIKGKAATSGELGMVKVTQEYGVGMGSDGQLKIRKAEKQTINERKSDYQPIVPSTLEHAVQSVTHQQMGDKYYPDDMGFENGSALPVSYAAVRNYLSKNPLKGEDGLTPYIKYGNWWIGDTDTGVKAEGADGKDGDAYVLTDDDKQDIASLVLAEIPTAEEVGF